MHNTPSLPSPSNDEDDIIAEIEERKLHLRQLEQSRDACNANIEILKSDIKSYELAMEEQNEFNYDLFTEIQTKVRVLSKRLEDGAGEIRGLEDENKYWSSRKDLLLQSHHKGDIRFIK
jgi:chromosome segregation ATPase